MLGPCRTARPCPRLRRDRSHSPGLGGNSRSLHLSTKLRGGEVGEAGLLGPQPQRRGLTYPLGLLVIRWQPPGVEPQLGAVDLGMVERDRQRLGQRLADVVDVHHLEGDRLLLPAGQGVG